MEQTSLFIEYYIPSEIAGVRLTFIAVIHRKPKVSYLKGVFYYKICGAVQGFSHTTLGGERRTFLTKYTRLHAFWIEFNDWRNWTDPS